jgi:hypothetical protein
MKLTRSQIARIKDLENARGQVTPRAVVTDAKRKNSPLHKLFDWNIKNAAEKWWDHRAREILGAVPAYEIEHHEYTLKPSPLYIKDTTVNGQGYISMVSLRNDPINARESLIYTLEVAAGHLRRALDLAEPLGLSGEIDHLLEQVAGVQRVAKHKAA